MALRKRKRINWKDGKRQDKQLWNKINPTPTSCFFFRFMPWVRTLLSGVMRISGSTCKDTM